LSEISELFGLTQTNIKNLKGKRTDIDRLENIGIDGIEKLTVELKKIGNKSSKLSRRQREAVINISDKVLNKIKESK